MSFSSDKIEGGRSAAIDLRSRACPTAADSVVALADWAEQLHRSLTEVLAIFDGITPNVPEDFGILNRARRVAGNRELHYPLVNSVLSATNNEGPQE